MEGPPEDAAGDAAGEVPLLSQGSGAEPAQSQPSQGEGEDGHDSHSFGGQVSPVSKVGGRGSMSCCHRSFCCPLLALSLPHNATISLYSIRYVQRARSQVSTAVSFEGARPAGSAALPSRSVDEESALSAAEADGEQRPIAMSLGRFMLLLFCASVRPAYPVSLAHVQPARCSMCSAPMCAAVVRL